MAWRRPFSLKVVCRRCMFLKVLFPNLKDNGKDAWLLLWGLGTVQKDEENLLSKNIAIGILLDIVNTSWIA